MPRWLSLVERVTRNLVVVGSIPTRGSSFFQKYSVYEIILLIYIFSAKIPLSMGVEANFRPVGFTYFSAKSSAPISSIILQP